MSFGAKLKKMREAKGLSQTELAKASGLKQQSIARWELDENDPPWTAVQKLAAALGVDCRAFVEK
ncbi:MAG TPA: helix-turn-helix transcriptional regulator [bacterium]|nr:helix-turn-helix transcriptional regulator [bacterium]